MRSKKYIILLLTTVLSAAAVFTAGFLVKSATPVVSVFRVASGKSEELVQSSGRISYLNQINVKSDCDCIITDVLTKENAEAEKGEELLRLAVIELPSSTDMESISNLIDAYKDFDISKAEYKTIAAPIDGAVDSLPQKGDIISKGGELLSITDKSGLSVSLDINELQISRIKEGQSVRITGAAFAKTYSGTVVSIADEAEEKNGETAVEVCVKIENPDEDIKRGYTAKCAIVTALDYESVVIPYEALGSDEGGDYVYKLQNGRAEKQYIEIESELYEGARIKSGVEEGESIVENISSLSDKDIQTVHAESGGEP